jgi:hypothetical protein
MMAAVGEEWRPVVGWETAYEVSNFGNVRRIRTKKAAPVRQHAGYPTCSLSIGGSIRGNGKVHRMVAEAFIPNLLPDTQTQVNHIDGNKQNPHVTNLEWVTPKENIQHAHRTGLTAGNKRRSRAIESVDPTTGGVTSYDSSAHAARVVGVDGSRIRICIKQPKSRAAGLYWRLAEKEQGKSNNWQKLIECDGYQFGTVDYEISDLGEVKNSKDSRLLHPSTNANGYHMVNLTVSDQTPRRIFYIHRLVASTFLELPAGDPTTYDVDHIDSEPTHNTPDNLQWLSRQAHISKTVGRRVLQYMPDNSIVRHLSIKDAANACGVEYWRMQRILD